ncbi:hypothetical protein PSI9734_01652 [Pseudidiomarina piscicola]|uniref:Fido domain-containing protein n=1 Tax=Pseudidiomarina piscicola TaxID=2614830 RepID=A0A6S6WPU8_9GAMM|nr:Fic family protein [Pseudidiomarina piscicola]CAB0151239.1 hypothetical protein PSI9734_01652 [Pseudidiomarina piscicola]VZT40745.1 hypothetical protein PSI9734_01652 [Pseudomonas aeruginosa]
MSRLYFASSTAESKAFSKKFAAGKLKRIRAGIYTDASYAEIDELVLSNWANVVHFLYPEAVATHITAEKLKPLNGVVYVTVNLKVRKTLKVTDSLLIHCLPGNIDVLTERFIPELKRSATPRLLLENLQIAHQNKQLVKSLGKEWVEEKLCSLLNRYGEDELNRIRDEASAHAELLDMGREARILDRLVGSILATKPVRNLENNRAIARAKKTPFDAQPVELFEGLATYLKRCEFIEHPYVYNASNWRNLSFYESYFSNYIEGTEFEIEEAEKIVFEKVTINDRLQDSHDVLSVFNVVSDYTEMSAVPENPDDLLNLLVNRHEIIMHERPDKHPGTLKQTANKAGDSMFVLPDHVEGTLSQSFQLYLSLPPGLARAVFMQFLVAEVHPFDDGNGRLSRIMMNTELVASELHKVIVPTVHRESYLNGLMQATRMGKFRTLAKVYADLHAYTANLPWDDYGETKAMLQANMADKLPEQGVATFNRELVKHRIILPAG